MLLSIPISSVTIPSAHAAPLTVLLNGAASTSGKSGDVITIDTDLVTVPHASATCSIRQAPTGLIASSGFFVNNVGHVSGFFMVGKIRAAAGGLAYTINVTCTGGGLTDSGTANFLVLPSITISPPMGVDGQVISVTGVGFRADASSCTVDGSAVTTSPSCSISLGAGTMSGQFTVVTGAANIAYVITAHPTGVADGADATGTFTKVSGPTISVSSPTSASGTPGYGTKDGKVTVTGAGFTGPGFPTTTRNCHSFTGNAGLFAASPAPTCSISGAGVVTASFAVALGTGGGYTVTVTDTNGATASAGFTVLAAPVLIAPIPPSAGEGTLVTLKDSTSFFPDTGPCTITWNGPVAISSYFCLVNSAGDIQAPGGLAEFVVPSTGAPTHPYTVTVTGPHGDSASTTFTVTPGVTISPNVGPPGQAVTVSGSGWDPLDTQVSFVVTGLASQASPITCAVSGGKISSGCGFTVAPTAVAGPYNLDFAGTPAGDTLHVVNAFTVQATWTLSVSSGGPGTYVTFSGSGFVHGAGNCVPDLTAVPSTPLLFSTGANPWHCNIDGNGMLTGDFIVATAPAASGTYTLTLLEAPNVHPTFTVTAPTITLSKTSGTGGDTITVTGSGFSPADTSCDIVSGTIGIASYSCTISGGNVNGQFVVGTSGNPAQIGPPATIRVTTKIGATLSDVGTAPFTVVPQMTVSPNPARVGDTLTVTGSNFGSPATGGCVGLWTFTPADGQVTVTTCTIHGDFTLDATLQLGLLPTSNSYKLTLTDTSTSLFATGASASTTLNVIPRTVTLSPISGPRGQAVTVQATGFILTDTTFTVTNTIVSGGTCSLTSPGSCTGSFQVSLTAVPGTSTITVTGNHGDFGTATFTVTGGITLVPNSAGPGTSVTVSGSNFAVGDTTCTITSTPTGLITNPTCIVSGGAMSGSYTVGSLASGIYAVTVTGSSGDTGSAMFTATGAGPTFTLTPTSGPVGTPVSVSGSGYAGTTCTLSVVPSNLFSSALCSVSGGALTGSFTVASAAPAVSYLVTAKTNAAETRSATYIVTPSLSFILSPTSGPVGAAVSISGSGYTGTTCTLASSPSGLISSPACTISAGALSGGFTVASGASGIYTVTLTTSAAETPTASFTVGPVLTFALTPISGPVGTAVSLSGSGYTGTTCTVSASPSGLLGSPTCSISAGVLSGGFTVASGASTGSYTVTVQTNHAETETGAFTVVTHVGPTLSPTSGSPGTSISVTGLGYQGTTCTISSAPTGLFSSSSCAISGGTLSASFAVAPGASGSYTVIVKTDVGEIAASPFTVRLAPNFALALISGSPLTSVTGSGLNYQGTTCTLSSYPSGLMSSPLCSISGGTLTASFTVASDASGGAYVVTVTSNAAETATDTFTVKLQPTLALNPSSGKRGTAITASGLNFEGTTCTISSPGSLFTSASCTISGGTLSGAFTVSPGAAAGGYTVTATTNHGETISAAFTVTASPPCIIATVTFGSEVSPAVQFLRGFRDNLVLSTRAGSAFMGVFNAWYYSFSPTVANFISSHDPLRAPIKVILYPLLGILSVSTLAYSIFSWTPEFGVLMAGLVASSLIGLVYLTLPAIIVSRKLARRRIRITSLAKVSLTALAIALGLLAAGELTGSFLVLAIASSAIVLICFFTVPAMVALAVLRPNPK